MIVLFGLVVLLGCLVLGLVSNSRAGGVLEGEARDALFQLVQQAAQTQESRIQGRLYTVESIANRNVLRGQSSSGKGEASLEEKLKALRDEKQRTASLGFRDFGIADRDGKATFADGHTASIADRDYFRVALGGKVAVSSTIISRGDGSVVFAYATPIRHYATNQINGVLFGLVDAGRFSQLVAGLHYGRSGYAFAVDSTGKTIAHKDTSRVTGQENTVVKASSDASLAPLARIVSKMARGEQGVASYTFQGQEWTIAYTPIKSTGWSLAVTAPRSEVLGKIAGLRYSMLILSIIIILVALLLTYVMAESVTRPLVRAVNFLGVVAAGDFTGKVSEKWLHRKDEIGMLARAVDGLQTGIRSLLTELQEGARSLSSDSESLGAASQEIAASSNEVAQAIQQVAAGTTGQAGHLQEIHRLTGDIASSLEKVQQELQNVKRSSETASRLAGAGKEELDALVGSINEVHRSFATVIGKLNGLEGSVNQVGQILEVINDITDQTNLLALNAAIEAARAGEAGRGFAVVAEEVRKLAEQSRTSSDQIKQLLGSIASGTGEVVTTSQEVDRQVDAQLEKVSNTVKSFDAILAAVADISPAIEGTYKQLENTVTAKDVVVDRVQSISAAAEQTSAAAEQISASAEELSSSTEEIAANAQDVLGVAKKVEEQVERFKL